MGRRGARGRAKKKRGCGGGKSIVREDGAVGSGKGTGPSVPEMAADSRLTFDVGTRVRCRGIALMKGTEDSPCCTGTVVDRRAGTGARPGGLYVRLDDGKIVFNAEECFAKSSDEPPYAAFKIGSRVECRLGGSDVWFPGTVLHCHGGGWARDDAIAPYVIGFDYGRERPFWGPPGCIRRSKVASPSKSKGSKRLRFGVGDRVDCSCEGGKRMPGTVVKTWYDEEVAFENGHTVPYQIQLDTGSLIYAPLDHDMCIQKSAVPPPECWICFDNEQSEDNLIVRECACRGENNGFVHIKCLVRLAIEKTNMKVEPDPSEPILFSQCLTCRQYFEFGSHCHLALTRAFYNIASDLGISNTWNKMACTMMSELLRHEKDYDGAIALLEERITEIKSRMTKSLVKSRMTKSLEDELGRLVNGLWMKDLSTFLLDLAEVYECLESWDKMQEAIEESLRLRGFLEGPESEKAKAIAYLARCADGRGDHVTALEHAEKAIVLTRRDMADVDRVHFAKLLSFGGELNMKCDNRERGVALLEESLENMIRLYGREHDDVRGLREHIDQLSTRDDYFPGYDLAPQIVTLSNAELARAADTAYAIHKVESKSGSAAIES